MVESLKNIILSEEFIQKHKNNPNDFTRNRVFPFHSLIYFLLNMNNKSYQDELDRYFQTLNQLDVAERIIYKGNLSKARAKLKHEAFIDLNDQMTRFFYENFQPQKWFGFNLIAIDGTTLRVPKQKNIMEHFGVWNSTKGKDPCPKARASQMFDVLNKITIDAIISPKGMGERELAESHFVKLLPEDLVLLDRGYPAFWMFKTVLSLGAQFCARVSCTKWKVIKSFYESGESEKIVKLNPSSVSARKCFEMGLDNKPIKVRLIRVELDTGETEILITTLKSRNIYPHEIFVDLYHLRWPVEEDYKALKYRLQIENFSGKTVLSVYQDFHAKLFSKNFTAIIATTTRDEILNKSQSFKYLHQINFTQALSRMKNTIVLIFTRSERTVITIVDKIRDLFVKTTESVRPNRKFPRRHRVKQQRFFLEYKTCC